MIVALTLAAAVSAAEPPRRPQLGGPVPMAPPAECRERARRYVQDNGGARPRRLGDLPPGVISHTVLKTVDGCPVNVLMRRGPDGKKLEVPAGAGGVMLAPSSERQRLPQPRP